MPSPGFGKDTFRDFGGAASDIFAGFGANRKASGDRLEGQAYGRAAALADQNAEFAKESTAIRDLQAQRQIASGLGTVQADVAASGFSQSGSAMDILRASAEQGSLQRAVLSRQGMIQEAGYREQAQSYRDMQKAAEMAADASDQSALFSKITGGVKIAAGIATMNPVAIGSGINDVSN